MDDLDLELREEHKKRYEDVVRRVKQITPADRYGSRSSSSVNYTSGVRLTQDVRNYLEHASPDMNNG